MYVGRERSNRLIEWDCHDKLRDESLSYACWSECVVSACRIDLGSKPGIQFTEVVTKVLLSDRPTLLYKEIVLKLNVWCKSVRSNADGSCVEVMQTSTEFLVRDSKDKTGPVLQFTYHEWDAFVEGAKNGEFELA